MNAAYRKLIEKLDFFIRQYYKTRLLRGVFLALLLGIVSFFSGAVLEYVNHFRPAIKTVLFFGLIGLWIFVGIYYIFWPLLQFFRIGKIISYHQAARIISRHFSHIEDKLLNVLELHETKGPYSKELIEAGITQKAEQLHPLPFVNAIDRQSTRKIILITLLVVGIIMLFFMWKPYVVKEGSHNLWQYNVYVEPPGPFRFVLLSDSLSVQTGDDLEIKLKTPGRYVPEKVMIVYGGQAFLMSHKQNDLFVYRFKTLLHSLDFHFSAEGYQSKSYHITVWPLPMMQQIVMELLPPPYTGEKATVKTTAEDITVPAGTSVKWKIKTQHTDSVLFVFDAKRQKAIEQQDAFVFSKMIFQPVIYRILLFNKHVRQPVGAAYRIQVVPDKYPEIEMLQYVDSLHPTTFYFSGIIKDDYGFSKLTFNYSVTGDSVVSIPLQLTDGNFQPVEYGFDFGSLSSEQNKITYYFEVWDNDAVNGPKSTRSKVFVFEKPSSKTLDSLENATNEFLKQQLTETQQLAEEIKSDIDRLKRDKIEQRLSSWEKQQLLQSIAEKQQRLEKLIQQTAQENKKKNEWQNMFSKQSKEIAEKQKQIQKLLESVMDEELKKLMDELRKLMNEHADEKKLEQKTEEMGMRFDELSKQLDKNLELLKRYEIEKRMESLSENLKKLAEDQYQLSRQTKNKHQNIEKLQQQQSAQHQQFEKLREEYKEIQEKNNNLEEPYQLKDFNSQLQKITEQFKQGQQQLQNGKRNKSSKIQQQNANDLNKLSQQMNDMMQQQMARQAGEDILTLKTLIDNIVTFSFEQEALMKRMKQLSYRHPELNVMRRKQHKLQQGFSVIEDSLFALSKRHPELNRPVEKELTNITLKLQQIETNLQDGKIYRAAAAQQFVMTSANNLALLLDEIVRQMENRQKQSKPGNQSCPNPGNSNPQIGQMKSQMQSLKQQLQQMINELKQGKNGSAKGEDGRRQSRRLGKMLSEYEKFNQALQDMMNGETLSPEGIKKLNEIKRLVDENINDLIQGNINTNTLKRHDDITVRLLEAENAERQRKFDNKRESREAKEIPLKQVSTYFKKNQNQLIFNSLLKKTNIRLSRFYEQKYKSYLMKLSEQSVKF